MAESQPPLLVFAAGGERGAVDWSEAFYDVLQNTVGGGKPKMRW
jgi:hypothetical protein